MKCRIAFKLTAIILCLVAGPAVAGHEDAENLSDPPTDWKTGKLGHLTRYIGTHQYEPIINDLHVAKALSDLLGNELSHLLQNLKAARTINMEGTGLILGGYKLHEAHRERATVVVEVYDGKVHAMIFSEGRTTIYSNEKYYFSLPRAIRLSARWAEFKPMLETPPRGDFHWVGRGTWK